MANKITNFIQFDSEDLDTASGKGRISTLTDDIDIEVVPFNSENPDAPTHRVFAKSPRGFNIEVGGIWKRAKADGEGFKRNLSIRRLNYNANLGRFGGQDDPSLQAILEWEPRN
ncbi:DUF736 family protein [Brucella pseudogrignonensis]|uniref:DUF736 family protein n=1 Tax=Brucella pseudogrignonensis TaxID=419475 RepID=UPI0028B92DE4|nr:DUF736 family protein [Brucella pseudogrignonensis]MDT6942471.1 DUF736 family protein [Brucella pseudogrignonensis]